MSLQYDREEQDLYEAYERGELTLKELNYELREMRASFQAYAEECAQEAYDSVMRDHGY